MKLGFDYNVASIARFAGQTGAAAEPGRFPKFERDFPLDWL